MNRTFPSAYEDRSGINLMTDTKTAAGWVQTQPELVRTFIVPYLGWRAEQLRRARRETHDATCSLAPVIVELVRPRTVVIFF